MTDAITHPALDATSLARMPKVELHCHLDGSLRPETMLEIARETGAKLPYLNADDLRTYMHADDVEDLQGYIARFDVSIAVLQTPEAIERVAYELVEDVHADGVRYLEVRNAPHLNVRAGMTPDEVIAATLRGLRRGERDFGTIARFIVCSLRHWDPAISLEAAHAAVRHMDDGVVAFDLAGPEASYSSVLHADAFRYARENYLPVTCHAGEGAGPESIADALFRCNVNRIGHGVRLREDPELLDYVRDRRIPLELCPTSNVQTRAVTSFAEHPIKKYLDDGIVVTVNTDNRLVSSITLTSEFTRLVAELGFSVADLSRCVLNGVDAAFISLPERAALRESVLAELAHDWGYSA